MNQNTIVFSLTALLLCLPVSANATDVFITIDEDGNRIFSDIPSKESRTHKIKEISTVPAVKVQRTTATAIDNKDVDTQYQQLTIMSPTNESTMTRDKLGNFVVSAQLSPALSDNDEVVLLFDGQEISAGSQLNWQINSADRGAHSLQVVIRKQSNQQEKISSSKVTVYVKR
jgi:type VI protein secretion system component Hcp